MGELGRYMGKLELGCEETDLGKVRERRREKPSNPRITMGRQEMEDTASTKTPRPRWVPNKRGLWSGEDAEKGSRWPSAVLNTKEPIHLILYAMRDTHRSFTSGRAV